MTNQIIRYWARLVNEDIENNSQDNGDIKNEDINSIENGGELDVPEYVKEVFDNEAKSFFDTKADPEYTKATLFKNGYVYEAGFSHNKMTEEDAVKIFGPDAQIGTTTVTTPGPYEGEEYLTVKVSFDA